MRKTYFSIMLLVAVLVLASLACSTVSIPNVGDLLPEEPSVSAPAVDPAAAPDDVQPADSEPAPAPGAAPDGGVGPEVIDFSDPNAILPYTDVNYYTQLKYTFSGTATDGSAVNGSLLIDGTYLLYPSPAAKLVVQGEGDTDVPHTEIMDTAGAYYISTEEYGCLSFSADQFDNPYNDMISDFDLAGSAPRVEAGVEVNGVITDRYALTSDNFPPGDFTEATEFDIEQGSLYRSRTGQIIRVELTGTGVSDVLSGNSNLLGQITFLLDIVPTNDAIELLPPATCNIQPGSGESQSGGMPLSEFPVMDDATDVFSFADQVLSYSTANSLESVVAFYKDLFATEGYTVLDELTTGGNVILRFSKDGVSYNLAITIVDDEHYNVMLVRE